MNIVRIVIPFLLLLLGGCVTQLPPSPEVPTKAIKNSVMNHQTDFFIARKGLEDGFELVFHIMPAPEGSGYSRTDYHLMVSIEKNGVVVRDIPLYSEVRHPDGRVVERTAMMRMGDWYMARYNLSHEQGRHWLSVTFRQHGKHYEAGVYYPEIDFHGQ